ncbi:MAG TPA: endolytic transglycosylase MltG [Thermoleophilia bacterium]|nr:endolytic transglycosylase MltG [Thermoleophilia bacterium]
MTDEFDNRTDDQWPTEPAGSGWNDWSSRPLGTVPRNPRGRKPRGNISRVLIVFAFVVCIVIIVAAVIGGLRLVQGRSSQADTTSTTTATTATVVVKQGMGATQVGQLLEDAGVIDSSAAFVDLVKARGSTDSLKPGTYKLAKGQQLVAVVEKLETGTGATNLKVTIPEGKAVDQVADLLTQGAVVEGESYSELSKQPAKFVVPKIGGSAPEIDTLEGLLFPSTYFLLEGDGATELIGAQLAAFGAKTGSLPWNKAEALGVTPYQIVIIASMIEKEASIADERPKVAAVIYNRLKAKMALGIDATVRYVLGKWTGSLTEEDLKVDSPFNTRINKGLPPSPISSPGVAALQAALEPADVDYLYYVLSDTKGHHFFTASYEEFLQAKEDAPQQ